MAAALPPRQQPRLQQPKQQQHRRGLHRPRWTVAPAAAAAPGRSDHPTPPCSPPELRQQTELLHQTTWHPGQRPRSDEYAWVTQLPSPLAPELLAHVQAEGAATIAALAHTRGLQLQLQGRLNAWKLAAALQLADDDDDDDSSSSSSTAQRTTAASPERSSVQPDWLAGQGSVRYTQRRSFGPLPGVLQGQQQQQQHRFFSLPAAHGSRRAGRRPLLHYRAPLEHHASPAAGDDGGLPCGAVLCWSEVVAGGGSVHSLAASPDGRFLAVTHAPPPPPESPAAASSSASAASSSASASAAAQLQLSVIDCSSGQPMAAPVQGVDGPILWVQQQQQHSGAALAPTPLQRLLFVTGDRLQVHCLDLPAPSDASAAPAPPAPRCVFQDPQHVGVSLAAAGPLTMLLVHAADGLPRQLLYAPTTPTAAAAAGVDSLAWRELVLPLLPTECSASTSTSAAASSGDDASVRLVPSVAGGWLLVRRSCAAALEGQLFVARLALPLPLLLHLHLQPLPLPPPQQRQQPGWIMEAAFLSGCEAGDPDALQLLVLSSCWQLGHCMAGTQPAQPLQLARQSLRADCYALQPLHSAPGAPQQHVQLQARHLHGTLLPLPDAFWQLSSSVWRPRRAQLELAWSSLVTPTTRLTISLGQEQHEHLPEQLEEGQQQQQPAACSATLLREQAIVPGFDAGAYASVQLAVPPPGTADAAAASVAVPLSLAWRPDMVASPALHALAAAAAADNEAPRACQASAAAAAAPPMLLACYGSYGIREAVAFDPELLQLMDRGWVVGVAHVRGGGWLGAAWAEAGRADGKPRSIQDLLQVAAYVQQEGISAHGRLFVQGASAGGWLAAAAMLQAPPGLFAGAVLTVPCCDPLGLLLHQQQGQIELGDAAADAGVLEGIRSWAPYDVLEQQLHAMLSTGAGDAQQLQERCRACLPRVLVRAGLLDQEVPLHDPVRFTARLRRLHRAMMQRCSGAGSDDDPSAGVLLRVVPGGHTVFQGDVREAALKLAFLLTAAADLACNEGAS